jgi:hypothetical protein
MGFEIDVLPVVERDDRGGAIAMRWGDLAGPRAAQTVAVIGGGGAAGGARLVERVRQAYGADSLDLAICPVTDEGAALALLAVLDALPVAQLWLPRPWALRPPESEGLDTEALAESAATVPLLRSLAACLALEQAALARGVTVVEPFAGLRDASGALLVAGPSRAWYGWLVPAFGQPPRRRADLQALLTRLLGTPLCPVPEDDTRETLTDAGMAAAEDNAALILRLAVDGKRVLLTNQAGIPALTRAADYLEQHEDQPHAWYAAQLPGQGSADHAGPTVLNRLLGPECGGRVELMRTFTAVAPGSELPARKVVNACRRRGAPVYLASGQGLLLAHGAPPRPGWDYAAALPHFPQVEA